MSSDDPVGQAGTRSIGGPEFESRSGRLFASSGIDQRSARSIAVNDPFVSVLFVGDGVRIGEGDAKMACTITCSPPTSVPPSSDACDEEDDCCCDATSGKEGAVERGNPPP